MIMHRQESLDTHRSPAEALRIDAVSEVERLSLALREDLQGRFRRRGAVVGCSGGVDSSVVMALCARALGPKRVLAVLMPERESSPESVTLARSWAEALGIETVTEDITEALEGAGCYRRRDEAVRRIFPEYAPRWKCKISLPDDLLDKETLNVFSLTVVSPQGVEQRKRLMADEYYQVVAASNFKQRTRMAMLYYHAELRNYAVVGTANKNEHDLGFFVKYGDGAVDLAPIQHLFKTQVYMLAEQLGVPEDIRRRPPTSDTYSAGSTQEEFFFRISFDILDRIWRRWEQGAAPEVIGTEIGLTAEQVRRVVDDLARKNRTTEYLRAPALTYPFPDGDVSSLVRHAAKQNVPAGSGAQERRAPRA